MRNEAGTDPNVPITIPRLARELADQPPLLTAEQMVLLRQSFDHAEKRRQVMLPGDTPTGSRAWRDSARSVPRSCVGSLEVPFGHPEGRRVRNLPRCAVLT